EFALKLVRRPGEFSRHDIEDLRRQGFTEVQVLEAAVVVSLTQFLNTLQTGLGAVPDFAVRGAYADKIMKLPRANATLMGREGASRPPAADEDAGLVERARRGDLQAFEGLVRRHHRRIYRTLMGIMLDHADAE